MAAAKYGTYRETDIADRFLLGIGLTPQQITPDMQRAVIAWMRFESGRGSITANNPWNLTGSLWGNIVGYWRGGSATEQHNFPIFSDVYRGVDAAAQNLGSGNYGYPKAVAAAQAGDAPGFLQALAQSQWCTCHYPSWQSREGAAATIAGIKPGNVTSHAPGSTVIDATLADLRSALPDMAVFDGSVGKRTWKDAVNNIPIPGLRSGFMTAITNLGLTDKIVNKSDYGRVAKAFADLNTGLTTPPRIDPADWGAAIVHFLGSIADPTNWARALAIIGGAGLILWGGKIVWEASA